ncbi:hypothetical protein HRbin17_02758 [bacterium HR17]|uniref:Uncharacterized protein n=1 Tax=Candidatus Fervidibacter japonicus TaxID=2035412 RepID=A0A2H5XGA8_9BACT|nr:hypothetical protein HRbin17_02758 [bacterium HR17]
MKRVKNCIRHKSLKPSWSASYWFQQRKEILSLTHWQGLALRELWRKTSIGIL